MYSVPAGRPTYGHAIGIIMQDDGLPRLPGDVGNLTTYPFPVTYRIVKDFPIQNLQSPRLGDWAPNFIEAARELEALGVKAISAGCGFLALLQPYIAEAVKVPVFMSSLIQVPLVHAMLRPEQKVGIITFNSKNLTEKHFRAVGWSAERIPVAVIGMEDDVEEFGRHNLIPNGPTPEIFARMEGAIVRVARRLVEREPAIGGLVFECTNMPPFADAVQRAVNLPVFDVVTLINTVHTSVTRRRYEGYM